MAERHVVIALRRKYAELKGVLQTLPIESAEATIIDLRRVGWVLRMFSPDEDLSAIKAVRPSVARGQGWTREALDVLRIEGRPMTAREIAHRIIARRGLKANPKLVSSIECSLHWRLGNREGDGLVRLEATPKRWSVG
jgi:hypothetical protein